MPRLPFVAAVGAAFACVVAPAASQEPDRFAADGGDIVITPMLHASVQVEHNETVVQVDPWSAGDLSEAKPADLILVTDDPAHHLDPEAIARLRKPGAPVVVTAAAAERFDRWRSARERRAGRVRRHPGRSGSCLRHDAGTAVASEGGSERLRRHIGRPAHLLFRGR